MLKITRKFEFDSAHRVLNHQSKCRYIHGHRYTALVEVEAPELNDLGMVVDFSELKRLVGTWIDAEWDHNLLLHPEDPFFAMSDELQRAVTNGRTPYVMPLHAANPTAENMAVTLFYEAKALIEGNPSLLKVTKVTIYETPNCFAEFTGYKNEPTS